MERLGANGKWEWNCAWLESYRDLGGMTSCGEKPCPRAAGYALWRIGVFSGSYDRAVWPFERVLSEFGKNALYAVLATEVLKNSTSQTIAQIWAEVQRQTRLFGVEPAKSEQGEVRLVRALHAAGSFSMRTAIAGTAR